MSCGCCCAENDADKGERVNDVARLVYVSQKVEKEYMTKHLHFDKELKMNQEELFHFSDQIRHTRDLADQLYPGAREFWPAWDPSYFNEENAVRVNNCMDYAFLFYGTNQERSRKNQPGERSNLKQIQKGEYTCKIFKEYLQADFPGIRYFDDFILPRRGYYLACLILSKNGENSDYHFLVLLKNGLWGHKPGSSRISLVDADGKYIWDPRRSNFIYPRWKYDIFCCFIEIPLKNDTIRLQTFQEIEQRSNHIFDSLVPLDYRQDVSLSTFYQNNAHS